MKTMFYVKLIIIHETYSVSLIKFFLSIKVVFDIYDPRYFQ